MKMSTGLIVFRIPDLSQITPAQREHCLSWIEALRSGTYPQSRGALKTFAEDGTLVGYCCLGVGADVITKNDTSAIWNKRFTDYACFAYEGIEETTVLTEAAQKYFGLSSPNGLLITIEEDNLPNMVSLVVLNDSKNLSFIDIALIIETAINGGYKKD